ncbi:portal protein [Candidatus Pelagibacter bacterium]|nr:portal protein [Candidatus Pelagibacter bacterium]
MSELFEQDPLMIEESIEDWVITKCDDWRDHYEANYESRFEEYYRLWRGIWDPADSARASERSRIISPALQQAVESNVAEMEEATFGRGKWFDISDNMGDTQKQDVLFLRNKLTEDFEDCKVRKAVAECLINSAVFGVGIGEIVIEEMKEMVPATQPIMGGDLQAVGVNITERVKVKLKPVMPQNFLIDPVATSIEEAMGVAIDEFVSLHQVELLQEQGVYRDVYVGTAPPDSELEPDQDITVYSDDKVRLTKYYGLVPRELLENATTDEDEEEVELIESKSKSKYVEAVVVIANGGVLLKAEANPYMMQDRPVVAFPWDVVPGRFWGRGVCEKGYNSQKALDTELRARIDALSLTIHPMLAVDATRLPRGAKPEVRPGKMILTNGDPREVLQPFNFGQVGQITFAQASALQQMVQQATGAVDSAGIAGSVNGEATAAGISMSLGAIIKRHKRTLINFQQSFLIPFVKKAAYRYMQFDPESYPVADYKFNATSSLGIIAREYEVTQLVQLLQTMEKDSPLYNTLIQSIIDNMNLSNREELIAAMQQASQPNPEAQQMAQVAQQAQLEFQQSQTAALGAQAQESSARATKLAAEAQAVPMELEIDRINAITRNLREGDQEDKEFERRMRVADTLLKERQIKGKENVDRQGTPRTNGPSRQVSPAPLGGVSRFETPTRGA